MTTSPVEPAAVGGWRSLVLSIARADWDAVRDGPWAPGDERPLDGVCRSFAGDLPVDGVAVSVMTGVDVRETVGVSDRWSERIEDEQYRLGIGPCYDAFLRHGPVLVADLRDGGETRWPPFALALGDSPIRALWAFPLQLGAAVIGAVDVYRAVPGLPDADELARLLRAIDLVALSLLSPRLPFPADDSAVGIVGPDGVSQRAGSGPDPDAAPHRTVVDDALFWSRAEIHQATGLVVAAMGGTTAQALARLRAHAYAGDRSLGEVSLDVIAGRLHLDK